MKNSRVTRTEVFEEVRVYDGSVKHLQRTVEDFLADEGRGGSADELTWRIEGDALVLSAPSTTTVTGF